MWSGSPILVELADAEAQVQQTELKPRGTLRMTASVAFGQSYLALLLEETHAVIPRLSVELLFTDRFVDLVHEGIDLAVRIGGRMMLSDQAR